MYLTHPLRNRYGGNRGTKRKVEAEPEEEEEEGEQPEITDADINKVWNYYQVNKSVTTV
jgi:hypothetical protein